MYTKNGVMSSLRWKKNKKNVAILLTKYKSIEIIKKSLQHGNLYDIILFCDVLIIIYFLAHISYMGQRP